MRIEIPDVFQICHREPTLSQKLGQGMSTEVTLFMHQLPQILDMLAKVKGKTLPYP